MIHKTAIIDSKAKISNTVKIGPYCVIGPNVKIDENVVIHSHVNISGYTRIGKGNKIYPFASIGNDPQDLKYKGEKSKLIIGNNNTFRESVTVNPGTISGGMITAISDNCLFMVGSHIAHDCQISSNVILANNATLAGHVKIENNAILGGLSAVHQYVSIGKYAMIGGMSGVEQNIIPYGLYTGIRSNLRGINIIGLKRKKIDLKKIKIIKKIVNKIFDKKNPIISNIKNITANEKKILEINEIIDFISKNIKRGICTP